MAGVIHQTIKKVNALASFNGHYCYYQDRLVSRYIKKDGTTFFRGKRVGRDCVLVGPEIRMYIDCGTIAAIKKIRELRGCGIYDALVLLNEARGDGHEPEMRRYHVARIVGESRAHS